MTQVVYMGRRAVDSAASALEAALRGMTPDRETVAFRWPMKKVRHREGA